MASLYLDGAKEIWYKGFLCGGEFLASWEEFMKALYMRFDSRDVVEGFNKLKSLMSALQLPKYIKA